MLHSGSDVSDQYARMGPIHKAMFCIERHISSYFRVRLLGISGVYLSNKNSRKRYGSCY